MIVLGWFASGCAEGSAAAPAGTRGGTVGKPGTETGGAGGLERTGETPRRCQQRSAEKNPQSSPTLGSPSDLQKAFHALRRLWRDPSAACAGRRGRAGRRKGCPLPVLPNAPINREGHVPLINRLSAQAASSRGGPSLCLRAGSSSACQERGPVFFGERRGENGAFCHARQRSVPAGDSTRKSHPSAVVAAD